MRSVQFSSLGDETVQVAFECVFMRKHEILNCVHQSSKVNLGLYLCELAKGAGLEIFRSESNGHWGVHQNGPRAFRLLTQF
jgi:hypothetical protein